MGTVANKKTGVNHAHHMVNWPESRPFGENLGQLHLKHIRIINHEN